MLKKKKPHGYEQDKDTDYWSLGDMPKLWTVWSRHTFLTVLYVSS